MFSVARLQAYLRHNARKQYEAVAVPPFTLFFHPTSAFPFFNYAIPDEPCAGDLTGALTMVREQFTVRSRQPRFEFIEEFAPDLPPSLREAGLIEEERQQGMLCTPETYQSGPEAAGLTIAQLTAASSVGEAQDFVTVQMQGFNPDQTQPATEADATQFLADLREGVAFLARLAGQPVGAGLYTTPFGGLTEVTGLATLKPFRRRGIATAVVAMAAQIAFRQGVEAIYLTAADEQAGRVYERVGFHRFVTMLTYAEAQPA
jgi:GNAT superfamily N-acetyltransferase